MDGFLTTNVLTSLRRFYQPDFEWFDCFAECDLTARIPSKASDLVNEFTDAVFDRNRVISEHIRTAREREETRNKQTLRAGTSATDSLQSPIWPGLQYTTLESWINQLEKMVSEKDRELEGLRNSLERAHAEHAITMSTSWRITEPLRRLASWVRSVILERVE